MRGDWGLSQWLLTFFVYGFLGWVWESCFVSIRSRKWVNRGFLSGPLLPAACLLLLLSRPSRRYFRVGAAGRGEAPSPGGPSPARGSAQGAEDWDPWDRPDRR